MTVAALFVETGGVYYEPGLDVDPWDIRRDARLYAGPWPVVAHPPCQRWGEQWHACRPVGHPKRGVLGDDAGCFASALRSVSMYGGILEHPAKSRAWDRFFLPRPSVAGGWTYGPTGYSAHIEQGNYGHPFAKPTWLYYVGNAPPPVLIFGPSGKPKMDRRPSRNGGLSSPALWDRGGGSRSKTPPAFRDALLAIARGCSGPRAAP